MSLRDDWSRSLTSGAVQRDLEDLLRLNDESATELLLVRHAEPAGYERRGSMEPDPMLSCRGLAQAEALAARLSELWVDAVYTAPERRAYQTSMVLAHALDRPLEALSDLRDIEFEPQPGQGSLTRDTSLNQRFVSEPRWDALPGFAPSQEFRRRAILCIESVLARHPGRRVVVVTHGGLINAYLSMLLSIPRDLFFAADHTSVSIVRSLGELYAVRRLNDTSHLRALAPAC